MNRLACLALILLPACGGKVLGASDAGPANDAGATDALVDVVPPPPPPPMTDAQPPPFTDAEPPPPGQCNAIVLSGPQVPIGQVPQNPPSFQTGGAIPDGTYVLQKFLDYTGPNGGSSTLGYVTATIVVSGSTWQIASEQGQQPVSRLTVSVKQDTTTLYFSPLCGNGGNSSGEYASSNGVLTLVASSNKNTFVEDYVKQ